MTQTVYGLVSDNGDGSASMHWFRSMEEVEWVLDESNSRESFWANEGPAERLTFPDGIDLKECGFEFSDEWVMKE